MKEDQFTDYCTLLQEKLYQKFLSASSSNADERFIHSKNVADMAGMLCCFYKPRNRKVYERAVVAGLVHDYAKFLSLEAYEKMINRSLAKENVAIYHAIFGWVIILKELGIKDRKILKAVKSHSSGRKKMTFLEEIIYVSDYIEESRVEEDCVSVRKMAFQDLKQAVAMKTKLTIDYLERKKRVVYGQIYETYQGYKKYL